MNNVREPIKKTSIEKKNKIIKMGFKLMCEQGYHNVSCIDIAKYADVSTGIIYQYFTDKRDIFIAGVKDYSEEIMFPMLKVLNIDKIDKNNLNEIFDNMIDNFVKKHTISKKAHEELQAMSCLDEEVANIFKKNELEATEKMAEILTRSGFHTSNIDEKMHLIYNLVDNYCHEVVYHKHKSLNYEVMKQAIIDTIIFNLNN